MSLWKALFGGTSKGTEINNVQDAGGQVNSWNALLSSLKNAKDPMSQKELNAKYGNHVFFILLTGKRNSPEYFRGIPFVDITKTTVDTARKYVDLPRPMPGSVDIDLRSTYMIAPNGRIGRQSISYTNACILEVTGWSKERTANGSDDEQLASLASDAINHYVDMPIVSFFFTLPYFEPQEGPRKVSPKDALMTVSQGVEGLLLTIYDEVGEGNPVTDDNFKERIHRMLIGETL